MILISRFALLKMKNVNLWIILIKIQNIKENQEPLYAAQAVLVVKEMSLLALTVVVQPPIAQIAVVLLLAPLKESLLQALMIQRLKEEPIVHA